jgi:hypothetical protein
VPYFLLQWVLFVQTINRQNNIHLPAVTCASPPHILLYVNCQVHIFRLVSLQTLNCLKSHPVTGFDGGSSSLSCSYCFLKNKYLKIGCTVYWLLECLNSIIQRKSTETDIHPMRERTLTKLTFAL